MNKILVVAFLFFMGSLLGWGLEVVYRRFFSDANPERKWINPGFLIGPYLPLYGFSLSAVYILSFIPVTFIHNKWGQKIVLFVLMAMVITLIEYIAGLIFIKGMKIKLWDYTEEWGNIKGIICPKFSFYWIVLSAVYYFLIHPNVQKSIEWLAGHLAFSFFIGFFYGVFLIDICYSMNIMKRMRDFAVENQLEIKYESLKAHIAKINEERKLKPSFMFAFKTDNRMTLKEILSKYVESEQTRIKGKLSKRG